MTISRATSLRLPPAIKEAAEAWMAEHKCDNISKLLLIALCEKIGRKDLIDGLRDRGRPVEEPPAKPAKKAPRKRK